jgi:hypothetical protein
MPGFLVAVPILFDFVHVVIGKRVPTFPGHALAAIEMRRPLLFEGVASFLGVLGGETNRLQIALVLNRRFAGLR